MENEDDIEKLPEPQPLEALQRDMAAFAQEDPGSPSPEPVPLNEPPAAAGQPEDPYIAPLDLPDPEAPEIEIPQVEMPEELKELVDEIPDISSTPPAKKPNAWQKRHGVQPPQQQGAQPVAAPEAPEDKAKANQQPPQPIDIDELRKIAKDLGAFDDRRKVFDWNRAINNDDGADAGNNGQEDPGEAGVKDAVKILGDRFATLLNLIVDNLNELHGRTARNEQDLRSLLAEQIKRRA